MQKLEAAQVNVIICVAPDLSAAETRRILFEELGHLQDLWKRPKQFRDKDPNDERHLQQQKETEKILKEYEQGESSQDQSGKPAGPYSQVDADREAMQERANELSAEADATIHRIREKEKANK